MAILYVDVLTYNLNQIQTIHHDVKIAIGYYISGFYPALKQFHSSYDVSSVEHDHVIIVILITLTIHDESKTGYNFKLNVDNL